MSTHLSSFWIPVSNTYVEKIKPYHRLKRYHASPVILLNLYLQLYSYWTLVLPLPHQSEVDWTATWRRKRLLPAFVNRDCLPPEPRWPRWGTTASAASRLPVFLQVIIIEVNLSDQGRTGHRAYRAFSRWADSPNTFFKIYILVWPAHKTSWTAARLTLGRPNHNQHRGFLTNGHRPWRTLVFVDWCYSNR